MIGKRVTFEMGGLGAPPLRKGIWVKTWRKWGSQAWENQDEYSTGREQEGQKALRQMRVWLVWGPEKSPAFWSRANMVGSDGRSGQRGKGTQVRYVFIDQDAILAFALGWDRKAWGVFREWWHDLFFFFFYNTSIGLSWVISRGTGNKETS